MDKSKVLDRSKKAVTVFFRIRRGIKIYFALSTGISTGIVTFRQLFRLTEHIPISLYYAALAGAATTAFMLLILEITRHIIAKLKALGLKLYEKIKTFKER